MQISRGDRAVRLQLTLDRVAVPEIGYWIVAVVLGAAQAWKSAPYVSSIDAVSYLDLGDLYAQGRWTAAINAYWSPLYSLIQAGWLLLVRPQPAYEYPVVKLADFAIFLLALVAFKWLLDGLRSASRAAAERDGAAPVPDWVWVVVGYTLFLWASLVWITVVSNTPDMIAAVLLYTAWGILVRCDRRERLWSYGVFGAVLALAFLARTALAVFAVAALAMLAITARDRRRLRGAMVAVMAFLAIATPFVAALSITHGRLTIGDSGKLNHLWLGNPSYYTIPDRHWQGGPPGNGAPKHPSREIWDVPATYEFAEPLPGTYPPWMEPSYWYQGLRYHFDAAAELLMVRNNAVFYFRMFGWWLLAAVTAALLLAARPAETFRTFITRTSWWLPPAASLGAYFLANDLLRQFKAWQRFSQQVTAINQPPTRYVAVAIVLLSLTLLASMRRRRTSAAVASGIGILVAVSSVAALAEAASQVRLLLDGPVTTPPWQIAAALEDQGLRPGMRVAIVGPGPDHAPWARLARVRIVAEVPDVNLFWARSKGMRSMSVTRLGEVPVDAIVATWVPRWGYAEGWTPVKDLALGVMWPPAPPAGRCKVSALCSGPGGDAGDGNVAPEDVEEAARKVPHDAQRDEQHRQGEGRSGSHADPRKEPDKRGLAGPDAVERDRQEHHQQDDRHEREVRLERRGDSQSQAQKIRLHDADDLHADGAEEHVDERAVVRAVAAQRGNEPLADGRQTTRRAAQQPRHGARHALAEDQEQREETRRAGDPERREDGNVARQSAGDRESRQRHEQQ